MRLIKALFFLIVLSLLCPIGYGQSFVWQGSTNQFTGQLGGLGSNKWFLLPNDTLKFTSALREDGLLAYKLGTVYVYDSAGCSCYKALANASGAVYTAGYGLVLVANQFSVDTAQIVTQFDLSQETLQAVTNRGKTTTNNMTVSTDGTEMTTSNPTSPSLNIKATGSLSAFFRMQSGNINQLNFRTGIVGTLTPVGWTGLNFSHLVWTGKSTATDGYEHTSSLYFKTAGNTDSTNHAEEVGFTISPFGSTAHVTPWLIRDRYTQMTSIKVSEQLSGDLTDSLLVKKTSDSSYRSIAPISTILASYPLTSTVWQLAGNTGAGNILGTTDLNTFTIQAGGDIVAVVERHGATLDSTSYLKTANDNTINLQPNINVTTSTSNVFGCPVLVNVGGETSILSGTGTKGGFRIQVSQTNSAGTSDALIITDTVANTGGNANGMEIRRRIIQPSGTGTVRGIFVDDILTTLLGGYSAYETDATGTAVFSFKGTGATGIMANMGTVLAGTNTDPATGVKLHVAGNASTTGSIEVNSNLTLSTLGKISEYGNATPASNEVLVGDGTDMELTNLATAMNDISGTALTGTVGFSPTKAIGTRLLDATGGNVTLTVTFATTGQQVNLKRIDGTGNTVTIQLASGNIDGAASTTLTAQWQSKTIYWDGTNGYIY